LTWARGVASERIFTASSPSQESNKEIFLFLFSSLSSSNDVDHQEKNKIKQQMSFLVLPHECEEKIRINIQALIVIV